METGFKSSAEMEIDEDTPTNQLYSRQVENVFTYLYDYLTS